MSVVIDALSWILLLVGSGFVFIGGLGLIRFPDFFTRLHAASVTDTAGLGFIALGLLLQAGPGLVAVKLLLIVLFMLFTGPVATHALAKAALHGKLLPKMAAMPAPTGSDTGEDSPSKT